VKANSKGKSPDRGEQYGLQRLWRNCFRMRSTGRKRKQKLTSITDIKITKTM